MTTYISITQSGHWAGNGVIENGRIDQCAAILGPPGQALSTEHDGSCIEAAYAAIEQAISRGETSVSDPTDPEIRYTWTIDHPIKAVTVWQDTDGRWYYAAFDADGWESNGDLEATDVEGALDEARRIFPSAEVTDL